MSKKNSDFKPYIPADRVVPEFTVTSVLIGIILAIVFGAANAYLGLKVGMTISAPGLHFGEQPGADHRLRR